MNIILGKSQEPRKRERDARSSEKRGRGGHWREARMNEILANFLRRTFPAAICLKDIYLSRLLDEGDDDLRPQEVVAHQHSREPRKQYRTKLRRERRRTAPSLGRRYSQFAQIQEKRLCTIRQAIPSQYASRARILPSEHIYLKILNRRGRILLRVASHRRAKRNANGVRQPFLSPRANERHTGKHKMRDRVMDTCPFVLEMLFPRFFFFFGYL